MSSIKKKWSSTKTITIIFIILLATGFLLTLLASELLNQNNFVFIGIDIGYGDEQTAIKLIDKVADYVNLIILGSLEVTNDTEALTRVCDYLYEKDLHFIVFVSFAEHGYVPPRGPDPQFFTNATQKWGDKFLGVYIFDEVGGKLMDSDHSINMTDANSYSKAATIYTHHLDFYLDNITQYYQPAKFPVFTSDYALYWYDYLGGYDVVFGEFVGNNSRQIAASLIRGAAKTLNKEWGTIITWSHQDLDSFVQNPKQIYDDMLLAYQNGAKYIIVFNSPGNFTAPTDYGTLTTEHLEKMQEFWNYTQTHPQTQHYPANTAYVLPADYGFGFRGPDDKIWGKWDPDQISQQVWDDINGLIQVQNQNLDIIYETRIGNTPIKHPYNTLIFWNGTTIQK